MPDPLELDTLRHLIARCEEELAALNPRSRAELEETFAAMDAAREVIEASLPVEARHSVRNVATVIVGLPRQPRGAADAEAPA